jgi:hypothetical protein
MTVGSLFSGIGGFRPRGLAGVGLGLREVAMRDRPFRLPGAGEALAGGAAVRRHPRAYGRRA